MEHLPNTREREADRIIEKLRMTDDERKSLYIQELLAKFEEQINEMEQEKEATRKPEE